jgi:hypothetical protein
MIFGIFTDKAIGILLLGLMGLQGMFMMLSPGSVRIQKPEGGMTAWIYNIFNLFSGGPIGAFPGKQHSSSAGLSVCRFIFLGAF